MTGIMYDVVNLTIRHDGEFFANTLGSTEGSPVNQFSFYWLRVQDTGIYHMETHTTRDPGMILETTVTDVEGAGEVTGLAEQGGYAPGASANLTAVPADGWVFAGWSGAATGSVPSANIMMNDSKALTATSMMPLCRWTCGSAAAKPPSQGCSGHRPLR